MYLIKLNFTITNFKNIVSCIYLINMGLFGFGKKDKVIDLSERYKKQQEKLKEIQADSSNTRGSSSSGGNAFSLFDGMSSGSSSSPSYGSSSTQSNDALDLSSSEDRKRKLAKRLLEITNKLEDISNQIYHLQQRVELLERKNNVSSFG